MMHVNVFIRIQGVYEVLFSPDDDTIRNYGNLL